jgi:hypothetical protein
MSEEKLIVDHIFVSSHRCFKDVRFRYFNKKAHLRLAYMEISYRTFSIEKDDIEQVGRSYVELMTHTSWDEATESEITSFMNQLHTFCEEVTSLRESQPNLIDEYSDPDAEVELPENQNNDKCEQNNEYSD